MPIRERKTLKTKPSVTCSVADGYKKIDAVLFNLFRLLIQIRPS